MAVYGGACSSDDSESVPTDEGNPELADVLYEGGTTDEALEALLDAEPIDDPAKAAVLTWPGDGDEMPRSPIIKFCWNGGTAGAELGPALRSRPASPWYREIVGSERAAEAHGAPLNGKAYFVVFSTPSNDKLVRVFTTATEFLPDETTWEKIVSAEEPITVTITTAIFDDNLLASDGGPFAGTPVTFTFVAA
jgi:hypothetical protein